MFSERVSKGVGAKVLIKIANSSFRRCRKFVLSTIKNKYPKIRKPTNEHF